MTKVFRAEAGAVAATADAGAQAGSAYKPAVDAYALRLIARIQRNHQDTEAVLALQAHYEKHGDLPSLANLLEGWAHTLRDDRKAADAFARAAECVLASARDQARAQALYLCALKRLPEHAEALQRLEVLLCERGTDSELERIFLHVASELARRNADVALRADVHHRLGQHYDLRLGLAGRAIAQYRAALELDRTHLPAILAAKRIYLATGKGAAAADMFELEVAAVTEMRARHALLVALARHHRDVLGDLDAAVLAMRRALKALPGDLGTLELLADLLRDRAQRSRGESAAADCARAAELYYQVARSVPRAHARPRLFACLALKPSHARAQRLLDELSGYGSGTDTNADDALDARTQAELDALPTGRYEPTEPPPEAARAVQPASVHAAATDVEDLEIAAWLDDAEIELIDDSPHASRMVPVTDRPPPPHGAAR